MSHTFTKIINNFLLKTEKLKDFFHSQLKHLNCKGLGQVLIPTVSLSRPFPLAVQVYFAGEKSLTTIYGIQESINCFAGGSS